MFFRVYLNPHLHNPLNQPARICQTIDQHLLCLRQAKTEVVDISSGRQVIEPVGRTRKQFHTLENPTRVLIMRAKVLLTKNNKSDSFCI